MEHPIETFMLGQSVQYEQPLPYSGFQLPMTPGRFSASQRGYRAVQPVIPAQGLVAYNFVPFVADAKGKKIAHMFTDIPVVQMSVPPSQLKQRLQLTVAKYAPLLANNSFGIAYLCYVAYRVSDGVGQDYVCTPGNLPAALGFPTTWP